MAIYCIIKILSFDIFLTFYFLIVLLVLMIIF